MPRPERALVVAARSPNAAIFTQASEAAGFDPFDTLRPLGHAAAGHYPSGEIGPRRIRVHPRAGAHRRTPDCKVERIREQTAVSAISRFHTS